MTDPIVDITCEREVPDYPNEHDLTAKLKQVKEAAVEKRESEQQAYWAGHPVPEDMKPKLSDYDWLDERFQPFFERMPSAPETMGIHLDEAKTHLSNGQMSSFEGVASAVEKWGGDAQEHYKKYFIDPLPQAVTNQQGALEELRAGITAYAAMLAKSRSNALEIAEETLVALDGDGDGDGAVILAVVGAAAGIAAAGVTGGGSLTLTLAIIGGGAGVAGSIVGMESEPKKDISGATTTEIFESMQGALDDLQEEMKKAEEGIAAAWDASSSEIESYLTDTTSDLNQSTVLPHEPDDSTPNVTDGGDDVSSDPEDGDFRPRT